MNIRYLLGAVVSIPLLPLMYIHGKRIRASVPELPEATGTAGSADASGQPLRLITIGESTIAGVGVATHEEGFTGALAKELAAALDRTVEWNVYAKSGYTVQRMTDKLIPKITQKQADLIVIGTGGNDAFTLNRPNKWRKQQIGLIEKVQAKYPDAPIVFTNMPPIKEFPAFTSLIKFVVGNLVEILGDELEMIVRKRDNVYYNAEKLTFATWTKHYGLEDDIQQFFSDGVHPSKVTYQIWGKDIARFILKETKLHTKRN